MRVFINPTYTGIDKGDGGIRRVCDAQLRYLPEFGIQATDTPDDADLIVNHGASLVERSGTPMVAACHGLMWSDYDWQGYYADDINRHVIDVLIRANAITAPSQWVAHAISRGMLAQPTVIYHGVDADEWAHDYAPMGYVLWNKARTDPVSDPTDMQQVAAMLPDVPFLATFGRLTSNVMTIGPQPYEQMRPIVQQAGVYLATARETFGIGTLEALAAGVPVAGWRYGGQEEIIIDGETGYLADFGDYGELAQCIQRCLSERNRLSDNAIGDIRARWGWPDKIRQYGDLYRSVVADYRRERPKVSVVVTCHNLAQYLGAALRSVFVQAMADWECIIVDDASTDETDEIGRKYASFPSGQFRYLKTPSNLKLSGARNFGWQHATGKYIIFLDADDMLAPNALDVLSRALDDNTGIHIAYGHLDTVDDQGEHRQRNPWPPSAFEWRSQLAHLNQLPYAAMMRREVLERSGGYRTRDWRAEDANLWCRLTSFGFRAAKVSDDATLIYRMRGDSKSADEARAHPDRDGDWTAWYPWRIGDGTPQTGIEAVKDRTQPNPLLVPFGAQGQPPPPRKAWPVRHYQHPAVSVIIPVGPGHARYLVDALDSLAAQTMPEWEAIVVNDSGEPIELVAHPWARVWEVNRLEGDTVRRMGAGGARNWGLRHARAPLVTFLDADDILTPRALELMLLAYVENGGGYVYSDWLDLDDEARIDGGATWHHMAEFEAQSFLQAFQHPVTCLIETERTRDMGGFDENLPAWEDWDFFNKLIVHGVCGVHVPEPLLIYRKQSGTRRKFATQDGAGHLPPMERLTDEGKQLLAAIHDRYAAYISGEEPIMACCGGNAQAIASATQTLDEMLGFASVSFAPPSIEQSIVRMEFIGDQWGEMTWRSRDGQREYRAGRDPRVRFVNVDSHDVQHLIDLGVFAVVPPPKPEPPAEPVAVTELPKVRTRGKRVAAP